MVLQRALGIMKRYDSILDKAMRKYKKAPLNSVRGKLGDKRINTISLRRLTEVDRLVIGEMKIPASVKADALRVLKHKMLITDLGANVAIQTPVKKAHLIELIDHGLKIMDNFPVDKRAKGSRFQDTYTYLKEQRQNLTQLNRDAVVPKLKMVELLAEVDSSELFTVLGEDLFKKYCDVTETMMRMRHPMPNSLLGRISMN
ncbi:MAG: hypothetical protein WC746_05605 [archaeon]|jgi:hypothetical protein